METNMLKEAYDYFNQDVLNEFLDRYGAEKESIKNLNGFESFVYEIRNKQGEYILKISYSLEEAERKLQSEIQFIDYLFANGISVSTCINSIYGNKIEKRQEGNGSFYCRVYTKALGKKVSKEQWNDKLFKDWGRVMGKMHRLAKAFTPSENFYRHHWNEIDRLNLESYLPAGNDIIIQKMDKLMLHLNAIKRTDENYGLIHSDLHHGNFFMHDNKMTVFDFDDIEYSWFINDIAIVLFYAVYWSPLAKDIEDYPKYFFDNFITGYVQECSIDKNLFKEIPYFLKFRQIILYAALCEAFDFNNLKEDQRDLLNKFKYEIEHDIQLINLAELY